MLEARRVTSTRNDRPITFLTLDDEFGLFEATLFGGPGRRTNANLSGYGPYVVTGSVEEQYGAIALTAENVREIALLAQTVPHTREARLEVRGEPSLAAGSERT